MFKKKRFCSSAYTGFMVIAVVSVFPAMASAAKKDAAGAMVSAELVSENAVVTPGQPFWVAARMRTEEGVHLYWKNPGDAGMAPSLDWKLPEGFQAGPIQWPTPKRIRTGESVGYCLEGDVYLLVQITPPKSMAAGSTIRLEAAAQWLACKTQCVPGNATISLTLAVPDANAAGAPAKSPHAPAFEKARAQLPQAVEGWAFSLANQTKDAVKLTIRPPEKTDLSGRELYFYCESEGVIDPNAPQAAVISGGQATLSLKRASADTIRFPVLTGVLTISSPVSAGGEAKVQSLRITAK